MMCNSILTSFTPHGSRDQPSAQELTQYMGQQRYHSQSCCSVHCFHSLEFYVLTAGSFLHIESNLFITAHYCPLQSIINNKLLQRSIRYIHCLDPQQFINSNLWKVMFSSKWVNLILLPGDVSSLLFQSHSISIRFHVPGPCLGPHKSSWRH